MAFGVKKIYPIDKKPRYAVGINIPFSVPGVFESNFFTKDAIKNNLINFFLTNTGERFLNPTFGGNLRKQLFEQIDEGNLDNFKLLLSSLLLTNFPSVLVESLDVLSEIDNQTVFVNLKYSVKDTGIDDEIQIAFN